MLHLLTVLLLLLAGAALAQEPEHFAVVVGADQYGEDREAREAAGFIVPSRLANAARDADLVGGALAAAGFDVERIDDPSKRQLLSAVNRLSARLRASGDEAVGVFYFAGHGAQGRPPLERDVDNYLIPIDADLQTEIDLEAEALGLSRVSATLSRSGAKAVVIILDACRDFALPQADRTGATDRGLVEARARSRTIVAYATAPGNVARDGPPGGHGPYASALARALVEARGARLEDVFYRVRQDVLAATAGDQQPWENSSLVEPVVFGDPELVAQEPVMPRGDPYGGRDLAVFGAIRDSRIAKDHATFLEDYPESPLAPYVENRLALLTQDEAGSPSGAEALPPDWTTKPDQALGVFNQDLHYGPGDQFKDCPKCPEMVVVPAGSFTMGSPPDEEGRDGSEGPQHKVTIPEPFAIGKYEVTFDEWEACIADGGCNGHQPNNGGWGKGRRPVIGVSWRDAQSYVSWLSEETGRTCRLPSETEWEYICRAGTGTRYWWGNEIAPENANYGGEIGKTTEVGSYPGNPWGLHDVHGNVWEWVEDCWHGNYESAPANGEAWLEADGGNCMTRVLRGGSWVFSQGSQDYSRCALRGRDVPGVRNRVIGFRVLCSSPITIRTPR